MKKTGEAENNMCGALIEITAVTLGELLGVQGGIGEITLNQSTGTISIVLLGNEKFFPPITETGKIEILRPVWLKEAKLDRSLKLIAEDGTTYIHR